MELLRERSSAVTRAHCCVDCCIVNQLGFKKGMEVVYDVMSSRDTMSREENRNDLRGIIKVSTLNEYHIYISSLFTAPLLI